VIDGPAFADVEARVEQAYPEGPSILPLIVPRRDEAEELVYDLIIGLAGSPLQLGQARASPGGQLDGGRHELAMTIASI
jgi:hypothetical protein